MKPAERTARAPGQHALASRESHSARSWRKSTHRHRTQGCPCASCAREYRQTRPEPRCSSSRRAAAPATKDVGRMSCQAPERRRAEPRTFTATLMPGSRPYRRCRLRSERVGKAPGGAPRGCHRVSRPPAEAARRVRADGLRTRNDAVADEAVELRELRAGEELLAAVQRAVARKVAAERRLQRNEQRLVRLRSKRASARKAKRAAFAALRPRHRRRCSGA